MINKNNLKNEKGITMVILVITVIILVLITGTLLANSSDSLQLSRLTKLQNDIKALEDRVAAYYVQYEELPINDTSYTQSSLRNTINDLSSNDGNTYYAIDLSKLDNLTLNYGKSLSPDIYIINEETHNIYYLKGVTYKGDTYYTVGRDETVTNHL